MTTRGLPEYTMHWGSLMDHWHSEDEGDGGLWKQTHDSAAVEELRLMMVHYTKAILCRTRHNTRGRMAEFQLIEMECWL